MAIEIPCDVVHDSCDHASVDLTVHEDASVFYKPDVGVVIRERAADRFKSSAVKAGFHKDDMVIDEATIKRWYAAITTHSGMVDASVEKRRAYEATCQEGTDAQAPSPTSANIFADGRSRSTICLSVVSGRRYLNGSPTLHHNYVAIRITSPDGRELVDVNMTFDQFSSFLLSGREVSCTVNHYWSINDLCTALREVVVEPAPISEKLDKCLEAQYAESDRNLNGILDSLREIVSAGKSLPKTKIAELIKGLEIYRGNAECNHRFIMERAREEVSKMLEQALCAIAVEMGTSSLPTITKSMKEGVLG